MGEYRRRSVKPFPLIVTYWFRVSGFEPLLSHKRAFGPMVRIRDCLSCGRGSIPLLPASSLKYGLVAQLVRAPHFSTTHGIGIGYIEVIFIITAMRGSWIRTPSGLRNTMLVSSKWFRNPDFQSVRCAFESRHQYK